MSEHAQQQRKPLLAGPITIRRDALLAIGYSNLFAVLTCCEESGDHDGGAIFSDMIRPGQP